MSSSKTSNTTGTNSNSGGENKKKENSYDYPYDKKLYSQNIEEIRSKNLNSLEMLTASVNNTIHPEDSIIYYTKSTHVFSHKYPVYPLRLKEELLHIFDIDTLFFMFFEQPNPVVKEMARKEIINRGWMYNYGYTTFFKLRGEPTDRTQEYIEGDFEFFDHEKEWKIKPICNFKFMLKKNE